MSARAAARLRRRAVAEQLAARGFVAARPSGALPANDERPWDERLRDAAVDLGPAFVTFARYLAHRPDVVSVASSVVLADLAWPRPLDDHCSMQWAVERGFSRVEASTPVHDNDGLWQESTAVDAAGCPVLLRRPRLELLAALDAHAAELPLLGAAFPEASPTLLEAAVDDLRAELAHRLDPVAQAALLRRLRQASGVDGELLMIAQVATVDPELLVLVDRGYRAVERPIAAPSARDRERLYRAQLGWLQHALVGGSVLSRMDLRQLPTGRLALIGGVAAAVIAEAVIAEVRVSETHENPAAAAGEAPDRRALWDYLQAAGDHHIAATFAALRLELEAVRADADPRQLRTRLRQLIPFRDGGWSERLDSLAEYLVLHWRAAAEEGFVASPPLAALYGGALRWGLLGRHLDPEADALRTAASEMRWMATWHRLRELGDPSRAGSVLQSNLMGMLEVPDKLDRLLDALDSPTAADGVAGAARGIDRRVAAHRLGVDAHRGRASALGVGMLVVALLGRHPPLVGAVAFAETVAATLFIVFGLLLLNTLLRSATSESPP